ncbi:MAG: dual OB domain-containing protein [Burkholderiales bacterium]
MPYTRTFVCLANSRKRPSGRCIAGREALPDGFGTWIRPVSDRASREVSEEERRYSDGQDVALLDLVNVRLLRAEPELHQRENHLIDADYHWERVGRATWEDVQGATEDPTGPLWINGESSSHGQNDRVPVSMLDGLPGSLYLIRPGNLRIEVGSEGGFGPSRRRVRAHFAVCGHPYRLAVTDPQIERAYLAGPDRAVHVPDALLCVSLGEVFHGFAYKLVASVIAPVGLSR